MPANDTRVRVNVQQWAEHRYGVELDIDEAEGLWQQATRPEGPPITLAPIAHIAQIIESANKLLPYIVGRPWTLVRFNRERWSPLIPPWGSYPSEGSIRGRGSDL